MMTLAKNPLQTFLEKYTVKKKEPYNFTNVARPYGSFLVPTEKMKEFYKLYVELVQHPIMPVLTEKPGPYAPVLVDFDFRFDLATVTRQFDLEFIKKIGICYVDCTLVLGSLIDVAGAHVCT